MERKGACCHAATCRLAVYLDPIKEYLKRISEMAVEKRGRRGRRL
jgi:hypothetical protein